MPHLHHYRAITNWIGNRGTGTSGYEAYDRNHNISVRGKAILSCSSDPTFRGDASRHNPEELLVASLSSCHMLWFLHLCADNDVIVTAYTDEAEGIMEEKKDGSGQFKEVTLRPRVIVAEKNMIGKANKLHDKAHAMCFIANSMNFPVRHQPTATISTS